MSLLHDENLSRSVCKRLLDVFPGSMHGTDRGLGGAPDSAVREHARRHALAIVTKDRRMRVASHLLERGPKVVMLSIGNSTSGEVEQLLRSREGAVRAFLADPERMVLVLAAGGE
jgi:predicted nuclease of predicted toxin-antitoxin system